MKKGLYAGLIVLAAVVSNIFSFSQGYLLAQVDQGFLYGSNTALSTTDRLRILRANETDVVSAISDEDEYILSFLVMSYGNYLEGLHNHHSPFFFLNFEELYLYREQYEDWLEEAVRYRISNPLLNESGESMNPFREIFDNLSQEEYFSDEELDYYRGQADAYHRAIEYVSNL